MARKTKAPPPRDRIFVREWRNHRKLTIEALAEAVGMTPASVSRIESRKQPYSQAFLEAAATKLGCKPVDLLAGPPNSELIALQRTIEQAPNEIRSQIERVVHALVPAKQA